MEKFTYKDSGVNLENAEKLSKMLSFGLKSDNFRDFAGLFAHPALPEYLLCATTDGIGTKILPLIERKMFKTMAEDLVAMNLNDLITTGAKPLFFLDYLATNKLEVDVVSSFLKELNDVLKRYNCVLLGGETSEMGDFIGKNTFDAAGFLVGLVKNEKLLSKNNVKENDVIIGLKSSGVHSNGFSLVRKLYSLGLLNEDVFLKTLAPTVIYADEILKAADEGLISACANITGGGILSNVKRAVPDGFQAVLDKKALPEIEVFKILKNFVDEDEMYRTFNMGAGFCVFSGKENLPALFEILKPHSPFVFGRVERGENGERARFSD